MSEEERDIGRGDVRKSVRGRKEQRWKSESGRVSRGDVRE